MSNVHPADDEERRGRGEGADGAGDGRGAVRAQRGADGRDTRPHDPGRGRAALQVSNARLGVLKHYLALQGEISDYNQTQQVTVLLCYRVWKQ